MKRSFCPVLLAATFLFVIPVAQVLAADAGDPIFPLDVKDRARSGVVFESIKRGVDLTSGTDFSGPVKADALYFRFNTDVGQMATLDLDLGALNPKGGDYSYFVGAGARFLAYDTEAMRVSLLAQIHYSPIDAKKDGVDLEYDYIEAEGGVLFSLKLPVENQMTFMPYAGPMLSLVRLDGEADEVDFDAEEKNLFGAVAGLALKLKENHSLRGEIRYFDNVSFSVAAAIAF